MTASINNRVGGAHQRTGAGGIMKAALLVLAVTSSLLHAQDPGVQITSVEVDKDGNCFRINLTGIAGEFMVESREDLLEDWRSLCRLPSDGTAVQFCEPILVPRKFYRVYVIPESDGYHLNGANALELQGTLVYGDLATVFGLAVEPAAPPIPSVLGLPSADREVRIYSATIATLSVLTEALRDTIVPQPSVVDIVVALAADLGSGNLDGRDSIGNRVEIGTGGVFLPEYTPQDVADALAQLKGELHGLDNVFLQAAGGGQFVPSVPADWGLFYWDSADWQ